MAWPPLTRGCRLVVRLPVAWVVFVASTWVWHTKSLYERALGAEFWHYAQHACFLATALIFWWPVVQPWPSGSTGPQWSTLLYLFLATLPCDLLAGFLVFSDRVVYPAYLSMPRHFGFSVQILLCDSEGALQCRRLALESADLRAVIAQNCRRPFYTNDGHADSQRRPDSGLSGHHGFYSGQRYH